MLTQGTVRLLKRTLLFCLLACFALGVTTDAILARVGVSGTFLPAIFHSKSLPASSLDQLANGKEQESIATARFAVLKQPLSVEALAVLAQSSATAKPQLSSQALTQAARLGWRNVTVQAAIIESAALVRNWDVVSPRLLALTRLNRMEVIDQTVFGLTDAREYASQIAAEFANDSSAWFMFIKWLRGNNRIGESKYLLYKTPSYDREEDCVRLGVLAQDFVRYNETELAAALVGDRCQRFLTSASSGLTINQHFGNTRRGPFEWQTMLHPGVSYRTGLDYGRKFVEIVNLDPLPRTVASKLMRLDGARLNGRILFKRLESKDLEQRLLPVNFECTTLRDGGMVSISSSLEKMPLNCTMIRAKLRLPKGRFQIWLDDR